MKKRLPYLPLEERIAIVKQALIDGWSMHVAFRKAHCGEKDQYLVRKALDKEINEYKRNHRYCTGVETVVQNVGPLKPY